MLKVSKILLAEKDYTIPLDEAIKEHRRLVEVLKSPSHEDDLIEADDQEQELQDMLKK